MAGQVSTAMSTAPEEVAQREARAAEILRAYEELKQGLWRWALGTTAACFAATYAFYTRVRALAPWIPAKQQNPWSL
jgi:hypothetical protein